MSHPFTKLTATEAAEMISDGETLGFSGFTPAGAPKAIPFAIAERAKVETPGFFAYLLRYAAPILLPVCFLVGILFFSRWSFF